MYLAVKSWSKDGHEGLGHNGVFSGDSCGNWLLLLALLGGQVLLAAPWGVTFYREKCTTQEIIEGADKVCASSASNQTDGIEPLQD